MSDHDQVPINVANQAVEMAEMKIMLRGALQALDCVRTDINGLSGKFNEVVGLQHAHDSNTVAIDRVEKSVGAMDARLQKWMGEIEDDQAKRWDAYERNRDHWREKHEEKNEKTEKTIIRWGGAISAFILCGGIVVAVLQWGISQQVEMNKATNDRQDQAMLVARGVDEKHTDQINDIRLFLARTGQEKKDASP